MIKVYMLVIVSGLVGGVVYGGYYYYKDTQSRIQTLTENSAKLETAKKVQDQTIATLVADAKKYEELNKNLNTCLLYTSPSPRDRQKSRMPSSA